MYAQEKQKKAQRFFLASAFFSNEIPNRRSIAFFCFSSCFVPEEEYDLFQSQREKNWFCFSLSLSGLFITLCFPQKRNASQDTQKNSIIK